MLKAGRMDKWVTLSRSPKIPADNDGYFEDLSPAGVWADIQPLAPSGEGRTVLSLVTIRFHDGVGFDTRILYGTKQLFVKGMQDVDTQGVELRLLCEESVSQ